MPADCVTMGTSTSYDCATLFTRNPAFPPPALLGMSYIRTKDGFYANTIAENDTVSIRDTDRVLQLSIIPQFIPLDENLFLTSNSTVIKIDEGVLTKDNREEQFAILLFAQKSDIEVFDVTESFVPSVTTRIDEMRSYFEDLVSLHQYSPAARKIIWSSVGIITTLLIVVILVLSILCCPSCCTSCFRCCCNKCSSRSRDTPPPPYQEERQLPLMGGFEANAPQPE